MAEDTSQGANDRANQVRDAEAKAQQAAMEARRARDALKKDK